MVLSCFDLVAVVSNQPAILFYLISWLGDKYDSHLEKRYYLYISGEFHIFSPHVLLVMNIERYLGAYYPIFHRTSVTRRRLLVLLSISLIPTTVIHSYNFFMTSIVFVISSQWHLLIIMALFLPPFIFVNIKLLIIVGKVRPERAVSDRKRKRKNLKNISTALWVVA